MAMRQYSDYKPPPERMILVENVGNNWPTFKCNFLNYLIASRLSKEVDYKYQTSVFFFGWGVGNKGQDVFDIYERLEFDNEEDKMDLEIVMNK